MGPSFTNPNQDSVAFDSGYLQVSEIHSLYYEQHGNKNGKPVVYLHGGPGGRATMNSELVYFDLSIYRVVLFDQRGAGKSTPFAELKDNTPQLLVQDIETLRSHLSIKKWFMVFGGSWGSTLAILYAETHPEAVSSLVLRGIFLVTDEELAWFYSNDPATKHTLGTIFPEAQTRFMQYLVKAGEDPSTPLESYYRLLTHSDPAVVRVAAQEWSRPELETVKLRPDPEEVERELQDPDFLLPFARIECSYFKNRAWLRDGQLLEKEATERIKHIPTAIVQGRYDVVCPAKYAWLFYQALGGDKGKSELHFTIAGHGRDEPETMERLIEIVKRYSTKDFD